MSLKSEVNKILRDIENPEGDSVIVTFDERPKYNESESEKEGRPVYDNVVYITKHKDNLSVNTERADEMDIARYSRQFEIFDKQRKDKESGIPIGMLPGITPSQRATCEACRVHTVEGLAKADEKLMAVLRMPELQERALEYLAKDDKVETLEEEIAKLKKQLAEKSDEPVNNGAKRSGRNAAVRKTNNSNKQQ